MLQLRRILCPVDFSGASRHALEHATALAGWYGSRITVLHVRQTFFANPPILFAGFPMDVPPTGSEGEDLEGRLREWLAPATTVGISADVVFDAGNTPAGGILEHAASLPADLIVMGTHGLGGFERLVLGSVAEKVLRKATCPVMTVPPPAVTTSKLPFKKLLCPVDFSEPSLVALRFALSIAQEAIARLTIMHVFDWPAEHEMSIKPAFDILEFRRQAEEQTRHRIDALVSNDQRQWCAPEAALHYGKPYREILSAAAKEASDLIVMGVQGRNALDVMLFGSTTNHVVRQASCPVLTLRG